MPVLGGLLAELVELALPVVLPHAPAACPARIQGVERPHKVQQVGVTVRVMRIACAQRPPVAADALVRELDDVLIAVDVVVTQDPEQLPPAEQVGLLEPDPRARFATAPRD